MIQSTFNVQLDIKDFWSMKFHLSWFLVNISIFISLSKDIVLLRSNYKLYKLLFFNLMHFQYVLKCKGGLESIIADSIVMQGCFCNVLQCHGYGCVVKINPSVTVSGCYSYGYHLLFAEEVLQAIQKLFFPISFYVLIHGNLL